MTPKINWTPNPREIRQFGIVIWVGFSVIGGIAWMHGQERLALMLCCVSAFVAAVALIIPSAAKPFYWAWMGFGFVMGGIMSRLVMVLIFFGLLTPMAIVFRVLKRDALKLRRPDAKQATYWQPHTKILKDNYPRLF